MAWLRPRCRYQWGTIVQRAVERSELPLLKSHHIRVAAYKTQLLPSVAFCDQLVEHHVVDLGAFLAQNRQCVKTQTGQERKERQRVEEFRRVFQAKLLGTGEEAHVANSSKNGIGTSMELDTHGEWVQEVEENLGHPTQSNLISGAATNAQEGKGPSAWDDLFVAPALTMPVNSKCQAGRFKNISEDFIAHLLR